MNLEYSYSLLGPFLHTAKSVGTLGRNRVKGFLSRGMLYNPFMSSVDFTRLIEQLYIQLLRDKNAKIQEKEFYSRIIKSIRNFNVDIVNQFIQT